MRWRRRCRNLVVDAPASADIVDSSIPFVGYATDCVVSGALILEGSRLTELLAGRHDYDLRRVSIEVLAEDRVLELEAATILREELCLVAAGGPQGDPRRRVPTRPFPVRTQVGPYDVFGYVHAPFLAEPIAFARRRPIIPVTAGWVRYVRGDHTVERRHETMLLNGHKVESLNPASDEDSHLVVGR